MPSVPSYSFYSTEGEISVKGVEIDSTGQPRLNNATSLTATTPFNNIVEPPYAAVLDPFTATGNPIIFSYIPTPSQMTTGSFRIAFTIKRAATVPFRGLPLTETQRTYVMDPFGREDGNSLNGLNLTHDHDETHPMLVIQTGA